MPFSIRLQVSFITHRKILTGKCSRGDDTSVFRVQREPVPFHLFLFICSKQLTMAFQIKQERWMKGKLLYFKDMI